MKTLTGRIFTVTALIVLAAPTVAASAGAQGVQVGTQLAEVQGSGTAAYSWFGGDVAISGDTAVVGAYGYPAVGSFSGGAFVFAKTGTGWRQTAVLRASDQVGDDWLGDSVAISGSMIVVGADNKDSGTGRVYVFTQFATAW
jgi:FG-GAP repeat